MLTADFSGQYTMYVQTQLQFRWTWAIFGWSLFDERQLFAALGIYGKDFYRVVFRMSVITHSICF